MEENAQPDFSTQLSCFFNDWVKTGQQQDEVVQEQLSFEQRLDSFFKEWRDLPPIEEVPEQPLFVDSAALGNFFQDFDTAAEPIRAAKAQGLSANVWVAAGLGRDEVKNSQVLKWFLDCRGDHGQGNKILKLFLELLSEDFHPPKEQSKDEEERYLKNYFTIAESHHCAALNMSDDCLAVQILEENQSKTKNSRVDIEIDATEFLLFIEVKIDANEGSGQLQRYYDIAQSRAKDRKWAVIYLTKNGKLPSQYSDPKYRGITWKQVAEKFCEYATQKDINNRSAWLAKQFSDHIKTF